MHLFDRQRPVGAVLCRLSMPPALGIPVLLVLVGTPLAVAAHLASKLRAHPD